MPQLAVLFDVDGVLTDSYQPHFVAWERLMQELGVEFSEGSFRATFGRTNADIFHQLCGDRFSPAEVVEFGERKEVYYRDAIREHFTAMPGVVALLDALAAEGFLLGVGSSGPPENVRLSLEKLDRASSFGAVITGADVTRGKPEPEVFLKGAERLGVPPAQCAVIEDAPQGIEAANRAGMTSIAITGTATRQALSHARLVVDSHAELSPGRIAELIGMK